MNNRLLVPTSQSYYNLFLCLIRIVTNLRKLLCDSDEESHLDRTFLTMTSPRQKTQTSYFSHICIDYKQIIYIVFLIYVKHININIRDTI